MVSRRRERESSGGLGQLLYLLWTLVLDWSLFLRHHLALLVDMGDLGQPESMAPSSRNSTRFPLQNPQVPWI